jgi:hypothetical protein
MFPHSGEADSTYGLVTCFKRIASSLTLAGQPFAVFFQ